LIARFWLRSRGIKHAEARARCPTGDSRSFGQVGSSGTPFTSQAHADTDVALSAHLGLARVQAHAHLDLGSFGPGMGGQVALGIDRGGHSVVSGCEGDEVGIALGVGHLAAVGGEGSEQDLLVGG
jgi:hypothetical protein